MVCEIGVGELPRLRARSCCCWSSLVLGAPAAQAQSTTQTPTAAQMEVFKNLPPDQQRMIMQQLQKSGTGKGTQQKKTDTAVGDSRHAEGTHGRRAAGGAGQRCRSLVSVPAIRSSSRSRSARRARMTSRSRWPRRSARRTSRRPRRRPRSPTRPSRRTSRRRRPRARSAGRSRKSGVSRAARADQGPRAVRDRIRDGQSLQARPQRHAPPAGRRGRPARRADAGAGRGSRLANDPALRDLLLRVTLLPLERQGSRGAEAVRLRPVHELRRAPTRRSPTSRCRRSTWLARATRSKCSCSATRDGELHADGGPRRHHPVPESRADRGRGTALRGGAAGDRGAREP